MEARSADRPRRLVVSFRLLLFLFCSVCPFGLPLRADALAASTLEATLLTRLDSGDFPDLSARILVTDRYGAGRNELAESAFGVTENGVTVASRLERLRDPVTIAFLFSARLPFSPALARRIRSALDEALLYHEGLDRTGLFADGPELRALAELSYDRRGVTTADPVRLAGEADPSLEGLARLAENLRSIDGTRRIVYTGAAFPPPDDDALARIEAVLAQTSIEIDLVALPGAGPASTGPGAALAALLARYGGRVFSIREAELVATFRELGADANANYVIRFASRRPYFDGRRRDLTFEVTRDHESRFLPFRLWVPARLPEPIPPRGGTGIFSELEPSDVVDGADVGLTLSAYLSTPEPPGVVAGIALAAHSYVTGAVIGPSLFVERRSDGSLEDGFVPGTGGPRAEGWRIERADPSFESKTGALRGFGRLPPDDPRDKTLRFERLFVSAMPGPLDPDGRFVFWVYARRDEKAAADLVPRAVHADGVELNLGVVPARFSEGKTLILGRKSGFEPMVRPLNPDGVYEAR